MAGTARAADHLLYFEGQEVFGYSSALEKTIPYSLYSSRAEMQKPSLGFDYVQRFSGETGDVATLAIQGRLAVNQIVNDENKYNAELPRIKQDGYETEPQIYNAYLKVKTPFSYLWIGHNRPAFGLSSNFDSHGLLLSTLEMRFGYDRDWGAGAYRDFSWGDVAASVTSGTGMRFFQSTHLLPFQSHYMTAARVSYGVLSRDNFNIGLSSSSGKTMEMVGYTLLDITPLPMHLTSVDLTALRNNLEHRFELIDGKWLGYDLQALLYRLGMVLDPEGVYKLELQPVYWKFAEKENYQAALCFSYLITSSLTMRTEYIYDHHLNDNRFLLQLYYYSPL